MKKVLLFLIILFTTHNLFAQDKSNRGKEFWFAYGFDYTFFNELPVNSQELAIYISTELAATVTITITNTGYTQTLTIPANTVDATILIPKSGVNDARTLTDGLQNKGIHIVSNVPVAAYAHVYATQVSGATMLMPTETYGYIYHSINYYQTTSQSNPNDWYSWFYVMASEDNTKVNITPSDSTKNGWLPNQTYSITLNKGESYHVFGKAGPFQTTNYALCSKDMTGSKIVSVVGGDGNCHPIAVFSGSGGIRLCRGDGGEFMQQQVFPAQAWGTRYLTYHTINNSNTDILQTNRNIYRVCVADPTTVVKKNGIVMTGLINNFYYEYMDSTGGDYLEGNKPMLVAQYMVNKNQCWNFPTSSPSPPSYGDPEMFYLSPIEQGQKSVLFYTSRKSTIDFVYANIHLPTSAVSSLRVDGNVLPATQIIPHPNYPSYSVAVARFVGAANQHTIVADSAFTGTAYGLGNYESYGYNFGTKINNLNSYSALQNTLNSTGVFDTATCPNTPVKIFIKLANPATSIHWKLSQVVGMSPNIDSIITAPTLLNTEIINGRTYYVYSLQQNFAFANTGTYFIPITYTTPAIANCNQTENTILKIIVKPGPTANFAIPNACPNEVITLTNSSINNGYTIVNYLWNFPDATTQASQNAIKSFTAVGSYNVRFRIFASNGCVGDTTKPVVVGSPTILTAQAQGKACIDSIFTFTSSIPTNPANPPSWYWNFGDGTTATITNSNIVTHAFATIPTSPVRHSVAFTTGCGTDTIPVTMPVIKPNPIASFTIKKDTLCVGTPILFTSSLNNINRWIWNFGNGTGNEVPSFYHTYNTSGRFDVSLKIIDNNGCGSLAALDSVFVNPIPIVNAGSAKYIQLGETVLLNATVTPSALYNYLWTPNTALSADNILQPIANPAITTQYFLSANNPSTFCSAKGAVTVSIITKLFIPNAFTPNNDGKNDLWRISALQQHPNAVVTIFNRYGEKIYQTNNYFTLPWDGKYKGIAQGTGTYTYTILFNDAKQEDVFGTVNIIR
jgi:gliding motility-associated-like protein